MKDKVEKAAQEYTEIGRSYLLSSEMSVVQDAFKAGAEWALANQWHYVKEELPKETENVLGCFSNIFLCMYRAISI